tara:strand:- start:1617 stop:1787 length:171 start_codon:yes stop_codon:yes gene_type:complete
MSEDEIENARREGVERGAMKNEQDSLKRRIARVENAILAALAGAAYLWAQTMGFFK